ncbi:MAG: TlpA family protein disulfide reductase [Chloroflexi bacterium]|nr:TlpA family protein disulfide reductase [Chloroflexota bacterium]
MTEPTRSPGPAAAQPQDGEPERPARRLPRWVWLVLGLLAVVLLVLGLKLRKGERLQVGDLPPQDLTLETFDGQVYTLAGLKGKVVLINFWASWCTTCKYEAAELERAWRYYSSQRDDVLFLGVDYVDTEEDALRWIEFYDITYPNGPDLGTRWAQAFGIRGVPETYVLDKQGRVAALKIGPYESFQEITAQVELALQAAP